MTNDLGEERLYFNLDEYVKDFIPEERLAQEASDVIKELLRLTGHLPSIHGVARGAGYCPFYARLTELIGARSYIVDGLSGKGRDVHKVMALASLNLFTKWPRYLGPRHLSDVEEAVRSAIYELKRRGLLSAQTPEDEVKLFEISKQLLKKLHENLLGICDKLGLNIRRLKPVVEQQFLDYDFHIRGAPDLILEDKDQRKAIVVEWKTGKETPSRHEEAQVIAYAILEAKRLGYRNLEEIKKAILGTIEIEEDTFKDVRVLPLIIRPGKGELRPHPIFAPSNKREERLKTFMRLFSNVILEAQHLTILLSNIKELLGLEPTRYVVSLPSDPSKKVNILTTTPRQLWYWAGNPHSRDKYPCVGRNGKRLCPLYDACGFYFGRAYGEKENYETILWGLRYEVLHEREQSLLVYRALQGLFKRYSKSEILDKLKRGLSFVCDLTYSIDGGLAQPDQRRYGRLSVVQIKKKGGSVSVESKVEKRIDVIEEVLIEEGYLKCRRPIRDYERKKSHLYVVTEGKTVLLSTLDADDPLLSINLFGRVDEVNVIKDGNVVEYVIGVPSKLLDFQRLLFSKYLLLYNEFCQNLLMIEVDVDLTHMDLEAIDLLQRALKEKVKEGKLEKEIAETARSVARQALNESKRADPDVVGLRGLLKHLIGGVSHRLQS